jgi:hypothetical protein
MNQGRRMDKLYNRSPAISPIVHLSFRHHFGDKKDEHRSHLLAFSVHDEMSDFIEQCYTRRHEKMELFFKKFHLMSYGLFYL